MRILGSIVTPSTTLKSSCDSKITGSGRLLDVDQWPRFRKYVSDQHHVSNHYDRPVAVGNVLPGPAEYYDIPPEFGVRGDYRYAIVNNRTVIVDPAIRVVVEVVD